MQTQLLGVHPSLQARPKLQTDSELQTSHCPGWYAACRLQGTPISVFLVHPGIVPTSLSRYYGPLSLLYAGLASGWTKTVQQVSMMHGPAQSAHHALFWRRVRKLTSC